MSRHPRTGYLMLAVGMFCLALAPLLPWYVLPRVELSPLDINVTNVTVGTGSYFTGVGMTPTVKITITTRLVGDVAAGEASHGDAVWHMSTQVDNPDTVKFNDPRLSMQWLVETLVFDRHTNEFVHCCGESPVHQGNAYLKFPFNVTKGTYQYWNPFVRKAFPVTYAGTVTIEGHQLYRFVGKVPPTQSGTLSLPGALIGMPDQPGMVQTQQFYRDDGDEIIVDPLSGSPIAVTQHPVATVRMPGSDKDLLTLSRFTITPTPDTEHANLTQALAGDKLLNLFSTELPIGLLVAGSLLVILGVLELVHANRVARRAQLAEQPQPELVGEAS